MYIHELKSKLESLLEEKLALEERYANEAYEVQMELVMLERAMARGDGEFESKWVLNRTPSRKFPRIPGIPERREVEPGR